VSTENSRPPADSVSQVLFANASDGWAFGPGLWATRDGGRRWHRVGTGGVPVLSMAAGDGRVIAALGGCPFGGEPCRFRVETAAVGSDGWRVVRVGVDAAQGPPAVMVSGRLGYVIGTRADLGRPVLLAGPADGRGRWEPLRTPCRSAWSVALAGAGSRLVLGCGTEPGAGNQEKVAYLSRDRGLTWQTLAVPPVTGYLGDASMSRAGTVFLSGGRSDVYMLRAGGRRWTTSPSLNRADVGDGLTGTMTSDTRGFVLEESVYYGQIWLTFDTGRTWRPVTIR
jgi:hypothetical protein